MIKINSTGYGIHASTIIYAAVTLFIGGGAWYNLQASQQSFLERIETIQASLAEERADRNLVANALKAREIDDAADRAQARRADFKHEHADWRPPQECRSTE